MAGTSPVNPFSRTALGVLLCLVTLPTLAQEPPPVGLAVASSDPVFNVQLFDGKSISGRLRELGPKAKLILVSAEGQEQALPLAQVVKITRDGSPVAYAPEGSVVLLPEGDRLYRAVIQATKDTTLEVQQYALGDLAIPLESLVGVVFTLPTDSDDASVLLDRVRSENRAAEVVWLANGDRLSGNFLGLEESKVKFQTDNGTIALDRSNVSALAFDPALVSYPKPDTLFLDVTLADGSRFGVRNERIEEGQFVATTRFGLEIRVPLTELLAVHPRSSALVYLTERPVAGEQYTPYLGPPRSYKRDRTVDGHIFRLGGQSYDRGLGTPSRSFLAYRIRPGDQRFQALVGLDDRAGALGNVVFRVLVDGKERFSSPSMSVRDTPRSVDVELTGGSVLILVTEFGERGGVRDLADWVEARLIRGTGGAPSAP